MGAHGTLHRRLLDRFDARVTQQFEDPACSLWLQVTGDPDGFTHRLDPVVGCPVTIGSIDPIQKSCDVDDLGTMLQEVLSNHLRGVDRAVVM